jgi:hypothetical protein
MRRVASGGTLIFWSAKADEIADMYREYGAAIHAQYQARF